MVLQIMRRRAVEGCVGLGRSQIYALIQRGEFPKPVKLGNGPNGAVGWVQCEIEEWVNQRIAVRDKAEAG